MSSDAPVYRQDEFVRQATAWTRPMQVAVASYLVVSTVINILTELIFANELKSLAAVQVAKQFRASGRTFTDADVRQAVDLGLSLGLVFGGVFGILFLVLALLTVSKARTWVFWVDLVLMALGVLGLLSSVGALTSPASATMPSGAAAISAAVGLVNLGLVAWMVAGLVKYGPWAQEKVPATL